MPGYRTGVYATPDLPHLRISTALVLAGCNTASSNADTTQTETTEPTESTTGTTTDPQSTWTSTTECDPMQETVIRVEWATDDVSDDYAPISFSALTPGEREILETVVEEYGHENCEATDAFRRFVDRVMEHRESQDDILVYLEYKGTYYGLYVQQGDMVFSSG